MNPRFEKSGDAEKGVVVVMVVYSVTWPQDGEGGVARKPDGWWPPKFGERELLSEWSTPTFFVTDHLVDLQPNNAGVKIFSPHMRSAIESARARVDRIEWLPVYVRCGERMHEYAIAHLLDALDVIDRQKSVLNSRTGGVIKPHLRAESINGHRFFTYSNTTSLIVLFTDEVYEAIKTCTGCSFSKVDTTFTEAT